MTSEGFQSLIWTTSVNTNVAEAIASALAKVEEVATDNDRIVTQATQTVTVLSAQQPAAKQASDAVGFKFPRGYTGDFFLITVCAATVAKF